MTRRGKIVCTLGPAVGTDEMVRALVEAGMDVARLNMSHGEYSDHKAAYDRVRAASDGTGRAVGILADLQGPKIRLGRFAERAVRWSNGETVRITVEDVEGTHDRVSTTYQGLAADARPGDRLLVDDGKVALVVEHIDGDDVVCTVTEGGPVSNNKGLSLPGMNVSVPALSEKDIADLEFALQLGVDMIALSFVRSPSDVELVHAVMDRVGRRVPVIAKLEKPEAVENLEAVVLAFDGIMVARGDLGVELPLEEVPLVQKRAIQMARENAKPVIVATQMLESMIENSRPTRAEASDAANAVLDGADALMLSGETSMGAHPFEAVTTMARIIENTEDHGLHRIRPLDTRPNSKGGAVTAAAAEIGDQIGAKLLVTFSSTGDTTRRLARVRPRIPMIAFTSNQWTRSQLALTWGVETFLTAEVRHTDEYAVFVDTELLKAGRVVEGDQVVIVAGSPPGIPGSTNALRVHRVGDAVHGIAPAYKDLLQR